MDTDIRVIKQDEEIEFADGTRMIKHVRVLFKVGDDGPFTRRFPVDTYSAAAVQADLELFARELRAARGR
jgi:hypothetical protein